MIIALLALAFAMIVGGLFAAFFGWDIVLVERGWTMVIAGSVTAASGALLLGIAAVVAKLSKIEKRLLQAQAGFDEEALIGTPKSLKEPTLAALSGGAMAGPAATEAQDEGERADERQATLPLFEGEDRRETAEEEGKVAEWPAATRVPEPVVPFPPRPAPPPVATQDEDEQDMKVPDFLLAERARDEDEEPRVSDGADLYHRDLGAPAPEPVARDLPEGDELRETAADTVTEPEREPEPEPKPEIASNAEEEVEEEHETAPDALHPAVVVGTYNSGDNKYVMFSDGSIEAQTPSGVFRFESLDELKAFIAAGGEGGSPSST
ncbi:hypothetical protein [Microvirga mediterraneensis]|uniref:DUF308 domain-containing protein n=1 Tax=Microvirga mediterraneensis TaxID=2754695 RepID=A0A838BSV0_9HYPH|nr:hypothetical protein [Microvirga mediterraneensis]MBA1158092.1 hypothetical protein [Microvirga mediterraneensis]